MHLGIDFDGTITDAPAMQRRYARERWGIELADHQVMRAGAQPIVGAERYQQMGDALWGVLTAFTDPQPDALDVMGDLMSRHQLTIVTARYGHQAAFARRWLARRQLPIRLVHTSTAPKVAACAALGIDLLLDDNAIQDGPALVAAGTTPVLYELPYNREWSRPDGMHAVSSWRDFAGLIDSLEPV